MLNLNSSEMCQFLRLAERNKDYNRKSTTKWMFVFNNIRCHFVTLNSFGNTNLFVESVIKCSIHIYILKIKQLMIGLQLCLKIFDESIFHQNIWLCSQYHLEHTFST